VGFDAGNFDAARMHLGGDDVVDWRSGVVRADSSLCGHGRNFAARHHAFQLQRYPARRDGTKPARNQSAGHAVPQYDVELGI
jgi:hypothetical protein